MHFVHYSVKPLSIFEVEEVYLFILFLDALKTVLVLFLNEYLSQFSVMPGSCYCLHRVGNCNSYSVPLLFVSFVEDLLHKYHCYCHFCCCCFCLCYVFMLYCCRY